MTGPWGAFWAAARWVRDCPGEKISSGSLRLSWVVARCVSLGFVRLLGNPHPTLDTFSGSAGTFSFIAYSLGQLQYLQVLFC